MNWTPLNLTVRVGCNLAYQTTIPTPVLFVLKPRLEGRVDGAFATIYSEANLTYFEVWAYQVNPAQVSVGDSIDLSKRLDGTSTVRLS